MPNPSIADLARQIAGAMVAKEPVVPIGWATMRDDHDQPTVLVAVVMGRENAAEFEEALKKIKPHMKRVDIFDGTAGEPTS